MGLSSKLRFALPAAVFAVALTTSSIADAAPRAAQKCGGNPRHCDVFVGTYATEISIQGQPFTAGTLTANADGSASDGFGDVGIWESDTKFFSVMFSAGGHTEVLQANRTKKGIGSKTKLGQVFLDGAPGGAWYARRTG